MPGIANHLLAALPASADWWRVMQFGKPLWLVGLLTLVPVVYLWMTSRVPGTPLRRGVSLALRIILVTALVLSLAEARLSWPNKGICVAFLIDQSQSVPAYDRDLMRTKIAEEIKKMSKDDQFLVIEFGGDAVLECLPSYRGKLPDPVAVHDTGRTDISRAIHLAMASFPLDKQKRIVLLSDGNQNVGDALREARIAGAGGADVSVVSLNASIGHEVMIDQLSIPNRVQKDTNFTVRTMISSDIAQGGKFTLLRDGRTVRNGQVQLHAGMNTIDITDYLSDGGYHQYEAQIAPEQDTFTANNFAHGFTRVEAPGRVLVIHGNTDVRDYLYDALLSDGVQADRGAIDRLPTSLTGLMAYDCVVLDNVPAVQFGNTQMDLLKNWVQNTGGGLVMIGGDNSFGPGGYAFTPLETISPVEMDIKNKKHLSTVAVVIMLDKSGSMSMPAGNVTKMDLANNGAVETLKLLAPTDMAQIGAVDTEVHWMAGDHLLPLTDANKARLRDQTLSVVAGGGGIYANPALTHAYDALRAPGVDAMSRHLILFADSSDTVGQEDCIAMADRYARMNPPITTSVIGLGELSDKDVGFQKELARVGHGRFEITNDPMKLPRLFMKDVFTISRNAVVEKPEGFTPPMFNSPLLEGIKNTGVPKMYGYVGTTLKTKPRATEAMQGAEADDPLLAHWQTGLGKVVAFMGDSTSRWSKDWVQWTGYAKFWGQTVRWASRSAHNTAVQTTTRVEGNMIYIDVNILGPDGKPDNSRQLHGITETADPDAAPIDTDIIQVGPGHYAGTVPINKPGGNVTTIKDIAGNPIDSVATVMSYPPEFKDLTPNVALLSAMAEATHGRRLTGLDGVFDPKDLAVKTLWPMWNFLMVLSAIALVLDIAWRRLNLADFFRHIPTRAPAMGTTTRAATAASPRRGAAPQPATTLRQRIQAVDQTDAPAVDSAGTPVVLDLASKKPQAAAPTVAYSSRLMGAEKRAADAIKEHEQKKDV